MIKQELKSDALALAKGSNQDLRKHLEQMRQDLKQFRAILTPMPTTCSRRQLLPTGSGCTKVPSTRHQEYRASVIKARPFIQIVIKAAAALSQI